MAEFAYNNNKNANTSHMSFEPNCGYHPCICFQKDTNPCTKSHSADELAQELKDLMLIYHQNLLHAQKLQKRVNDKSMKIWSDILGEKILLNSKYIKK